MINGNFFSLLYIGSVASKFSCIKWQGKYEAHSVGGPQTTQSLFLLPELVFMLGTIEKTARGVPMWQCKIENVVFEELPFVKYERLQALVSALTWPSVKKSLLQHLLTELVDEMSLQCCLRCSPRIRPPRELWPYSQILRSLVGFRLNQVKKLCDFRTLSNI